MPPVALVMPERRVPLTDELAATLRHELELQGMLAEPFVGAFPEDRLGQVYVLLEPARWLADHGAMLDAFALRRTIVVADEIPVSDEEQLAKLMAAAGSVFVEGPRALVELQRIGLQPRMLRPGYSASLDRYDANADRPVDVAVLGTEAGYLDSIVPALHERACVVVPAGESRLDTLAAAKVALNLHRDSGSQLEWRRAVEAIQCGAVLVTEHSDAISPLDVGEHLLVGDRKSLPFIADALLRDPDRLAQMRAAAYTRLRDWIPYALPVSVLRAAIVELVGEPVAS